MEMDASPHHLRTTCQYTHSLTGSSIKSEQWANAVEQAQRRLQHTATGSTRV
jgi:hypothetical protein